MYSSTLIHTSEAATIVVVNRDKHAQMQMQTEIQSKADRCRLKTFSHKQTWPLLTLTNVRTSTHTQYLALKCRPMEEGKLWYHAASCNTFKFYWDWSLFEKATSLQKYYTLITVMWEDKWKVTCSSRKSSVFYWLRFQREPQIFVQASNHYPIVQNDEPETKNGIQEHSMYFSIYKVILYEWCI